MVASVVSAAIPAAFVFSAHRSELAELRRSDELRTEFCHNVRRHALVLTLQLENDKGEFRKRAAETFVRVYELGTTLSLCLPGSTIDMMQAGQCWGLSENFDCVVPVARRFVNELYLRWPPKS